MRENPIAALDLDRESIQRMCRERGYVGPRCRVSNRHHQCTLVQVCTCTCHELDNDRIGWLRAEMTETIEQMHGMLGVDPATIEWYAAATVLAVWWCGTDHVRIQHALGKGPAVIFRAAERLRAAGVWEGELWHAAYAKEDASDAELLELALHVLVAEGKVGATRVGDEFEYWAVRPDPVTGSDDPGVG